MLENVLERRFTTGSKERHVMELLPKAGFQQCEAVGVGWLQQPNQARWHMQHPHVPPHVAREEVGLQVRAARIRQ